MWFPASCTGRAGLVSVVVLLNLGAIIFQGNVHPHLLNVGSKWFCMFHHSGGIVDLFSHYLRIPQFYHCNSQFGLKYHMAADRQQRS